MSDSVFEDEGAGTPPTAAQSAEEGDKLESSPNSAESETTEREEGERQPTQMHSETGQNQLVCQLVLFSFSVSDGVSSHGCHLKMFNAFIVAFPPGGERPAHLVTEQTEVPPPRVRTEGQQMNGIIEDRSSVSSTDMLVSIHCEETKDRHKLKQILLYVSFL